MSAGPGAGGRPGRKGMEADHYQAPPQWPQRAPGEVGRPRPPHLRPGSWPARFPDDQQKAHLGPQTAQLLAQAGLAVAGRRRGAGSRTSSTHRQASLRVMPPTDFLRPSGSGRASQRWQRPSQVRSKPGGRGGEAVPGRVRRVCGNRLRGAEPSDPGAGAAPCSPRSRPGGEGTRAARRQRQRTQLWGSDWGWRTGRGEASSKPGLWIRAARREGGVSVGKQGSGFGTR